MQPEEESGVSAVECSCLQAVTCYIKLLACGSHTLLTAWLLPQETAGGLIMSTSGSKPIHEAVIGTVMAVGEDVEVCSCGGVGA